MKCSIMQPHFLPWIGYFNLITQSEKFIFLDDAQFSKNNWHNRNRILNNNLPLWISVPIKSGNLKKRINETEIVSDDRWKKKMVRKIFSIYKKHPFINDLDLIFDYITRFQNNSLSKLNISLIELISENLDINTNKFINSSKIIIDPKLKRTDKLISILETIGAKIYITPEGSLDYLKEDNFTKKTSIQIKKRDYNIRKYDQYNSKKFIERLSIVDLIANKGWKGSRKYI